VNQRFLVFICGLFGRGVCLGLGLWLDELKKEGPKRQRLWMRKDQRQRPQLRKHYLTESRHLLEIDAQSSSVKLIILSLHHREQMPACLKAPLHFHYAAI
jgi:hypothetical protein